MAISPSGSFIFISKLWNGSASDKKNVEGSGLLRTLMYGDIMIHREILISGTIALRGAILNIPPFIFGKQLTSRATNNTIRIARSWMIVDRATGELKNLINVTLFSSF